MLRNRLPDGRSWKRLWEGWVGVLHDAVVLLEHRARKMSRMDGRGAHDDLCSRVHCPLEGLAVNSTAVPVPDSDAAGQHTLNGAPVECGEDGGGRLALFKLQRRKCRRCLPSWRVTWCWWSR